MIRCALVTIGDELLYGNIDDTNATWLSQQLTIVEQSQHHVSP